MVLSLFIAISMMLTIPFLSYLNRKANKISPAKGSYFRMPKAYLYMGYLMIFMSLIIGIGPRLMENAPEYYPPIVWLLIVVIFAFGLYLMRLYRVHNVIIDDEIFIVRSTFGQEKTFKIDQIKSIRISFLTYFITIEEQDGKKGKVYFHLQGLIKLLREVESKSGTDISTIEKVLKL